MSYQVVIRRNSDNVKRVHVDLGEWNREMINDVETIDEYWWLEGNGGCDCNRKHLFDAVADPDAPDDDISCPCNVGPNEYSVLEARLPDGTIIPLET